eukprot:gene11812-36_t
MSRSLTLFHRVSPSPYSHSQCNRDSRNAIVTASLVPWPQELQQTRFALAMLAMENQAAHQGSRSQLPCPQGTSGLNVQGVRGQKRDMGRLTSLDSVTRRGEAMPQPHPEHGPEHQPNPVAPSQPQPQQPPPQQQEQPPGKPVGIPEGNTALWMSTEQCPNGLWVVLPLEMDPGWIIPSVSTSHKGNLPAAGHPANAWVTWFGKDLSHYKRVADLLEDWDKGLRLNDEPATLYQIPMLAPLRVLEHPAWIDGRQQPPGEVASNKCKDPQKPWRQGDATRGRVLKLKSVVYLVHKLVVGASKEGDKVVLKPDDAMTVEEAIVCLKPYWQNATLSKLSKAKKVLTRDINITPQAYEKALKEHHPVAFNKLFGPSSGWGS